MRAVLTLLAALLIAVLTTALVGPYFIDWTQHRATIEGQLSAALGRSVKVNGPIDAALLPTPYLRLGDLTIADAKTGQPVFSCRETRLELGLASLMRGEFRFTQASFESPHLQLTRSAQGGVLPPAFDLKLAPESVALDAVSIRNATLDVAGGGAPALTVGGIDLDAEADSLRGPFKGSGRAAGAKGAPIPFRFATGALERDKLRIKFVADGGANAPRGEFDGALALGGAAALGYSGTAAFSGAFPAADGSAPTPWRVAGDLAANLNAAALDNLEARLGDDEHSLTAQGSARIAFGATPRLDATLGAKELNLDGLLRDKGAESASPGRAYRALASFLADVGLDKGTPLPVSLKFDAPAIILGGDTIADLSLTASAAPGAPVSGRLEATAPGRSRFTASGAVELGAAAAFKGKLEARIGSIERLRDWASKDDPELLARLVALGDALPYRSASLTGDVDISGASFAARNLTLDLERSTLTGTLAWTRAVGADRARLFMDLQTDLADIDALPNFSASGEFLQGVDLSIALDARAFRVARLGEGPIESGSLKLKLAKNGEEVTLDNLSIDNFGGATVAASGALKPGERWLNASLDAARLREFALLLRRIAPGAASEALLARAGALSPAKLTFNARSAGPVKDSPWSPDSLTMQGAIGPTRINAKLDRAADGANRLGASLSLDAPEASILLRQLGLEALPLTGLGRGAINLTAHGAWGEGFETEASASLAGSDLTWRGHALGAATKAQGSATLKAANVMPLLATLGIVLPDLANGAPADLAADLTWAGDEIALSHVKGAAAGANLLGDLAYRPATAASDLGVAPLPGLRGALAFDRLPLGALTGLALGAPQPARAGALWSDLKFASGLANPPTADIALKIGALDILDGLTARDATARLTLGQGLVGLADLSMKVAGGAVSGHATLRRDGVNAALSGGLKLDSLAIERPSLGAKIGGSLEFAGTGQSASALVAGLAGAGRIQLTGAHIARFDPDALTRLVDKAQTPDFPVDPTNVNHSLGLEVDRQPMQVVDADAPASLIAGILRAGPFEARRAKGGASLQASLDLRSLALDIRAAVSEPQAPKYWSGAPPAFNMTLKGPAGAPVREIDSANLANGLETQAIARETERIAEFESDIRERAFFNRRLKASQFMRQRELELDAYAADQARQKSEAERRRVEAETLKASDEARAAADAARKANEEMRKLNDFAPALPPEPPPPPAGPAAAAQTILAPASVQPPPRPPQPAARETIDPTTGGLY